MNDPRLWSRCALRLILLLAVGVAGGGALRADETAPADKLPAGKAEFAMAVGDKQLAVYTYRPESYRDGPLLVVMHGMNRDADNYRDNAVVLGDRFDALVVAPRFDEAQFPFEAYQLGGVKQNGEVQPADAWTFAALPHVVAEVRRREQRPDMPYYLIGHSAGGQFLTRLAGFMPDGAARIVAANPGTHLFATRELPFPYGFGELPDTLSDDDALRRYLAVPLTLYLGTADTGSKNLDQRATAMEQGATRIERGRRAYELGKQLAEENGWPFHWRLVEAPEVDHSSALMFRHAHVEAALFGTLDGQPVAGNVLATEAATVGESGN